MTVDLYVVPDDASPEGLSPEEWIRVVEHVRACFPYSRPWTVETQQVFYEALCRFDYPELIGAASRVAQSTRRKDPRERPSLAEFREFALVQREALVRVREEIRSGAASEQRFQGWHKAKLDPPGEDAGPYVRLAYAISTGEVPPYDPVARDAFLAAHGLRENSSSVRYRF